MRQAARKDGFSIHNAHAASRKKDGFSIHNAHAASRKKRCFSIHNVHAAEPRDLKNPKTQNLKSKMERVRFFHA
jgi:hypothetical protein